jgi:hypothetical protein
MQWFIDNREWFFSGAGIFALSVVGGWLFKNKVAVKQVQKSGSNSTNYQAGGDIKIGKPDDK